MGVLALIAACTLLVRRHRRRTGSRSFLVWYLVLGIGLLSALGAETPFGHVLYVLPGFRDERLLNRNLLLVDFALAALFAWWVHLLLEGRPETVAPSPRWRTGLRSRWRPGRRAELIATCAPLAVVLVFTVVVWAGGSFLDRVLGAQFGVPVATHYAVAGLVTVGALVAGAATWIALAEERLSGRRLRRLLAGVLAVDLLFFNVFVLRPPVGLTLAQAQGPSATAFTHLVGNGRFLIYDPDQYHGDEFRVLGQTDLNSFNALSSGQGYTALTDGTYYDATGAHYQEDFAPTSLAGTVWDELNVTTLLSLPGYFLTPVGAPDPSASIRFAPSPPAYNGSPAAKTGPVDLRPGATHLWYFGRPLTLEGWSFSVPAGDAARIQVGLVDAAGATAWLPASAARRSGAGGRTVQVATSGVVHAAGLVVRNTGRATSVVSIPTARTAEAGTVSLDGPLQYGVDGDHWVYAGTFGSFGVFRNTAPRGWAWAQAPGGAVSPGTSVRAGPPGGAGGQQIAVHAAGAVDLERSVSWTTGWSVSVRTAGGAAVGGASVVQSGVIQQVRLPRAGDYVLDFSYAAPSALVGIALSALAVAVLVGWAIAEGVVARRRRAARRR